MGSDKLVLYFFSVGNGHSTLVLFPNGQTALIDINTSGRSNPVALLTGSGITSIDYLIITHPHRDHITGLTELLRKITIQNVVFSPAVFRPDPVYEDWQTYENIRTNVFILWRTIFGHTVGGFLNKGVQVGGVRVSYLLPYWWLPPLRRNLGVNDMSLMVRLSYGTNRIIICGDTEEAGWKGILDWDIKDTTLLLASHHGNKSGYNIQKMQVMAPKYVVISAGEKTESDADSRYKYHTDKLNNPFFVAMLGHTTKRLFTTRQSGVMATFNPFTIEEIVNV